jgi:hypothetical protein
VINDNVGTACAYSCFAAVIEWLEAVSTGVLSKKHEEARLEEATKTQKRVQQERSKLAPVRELCKKAYCRQCFRCGFGPVFHDHCGDLTAYHGINSLTHYKRDIRIDNSCPNCHWFGVTWYDWPLWDGKFMFEREEVLVGDDGKFERKLTKKDLARIEKQNLNCLIASLRAHAKQCGQCGYGPVLHHHCNLLNTHHGDQVAGGRINNSCPECGWFASDWSLWKPWSGKMGAIKRKPKPVAEATATLEAVVETTAAREELGAEEIVEPTTAELGSIEEVAVEVGVS